MSNQNRLLLISSYFFYSCWDWRFLSLLVFSTLLDYFTGIKISNSTSPKTKKIWFILSIGVNLGFLGVFKYFNFFADSLEIFLKSLGFQTNIWSISVILPIGISFYTFHGLSYVIDIYKGRIKPEKNFIDYSLFVSYFPLLVAGPIERATHLLPQLQKNRIFNYSNSVDGLKQILWGLFKKIVIADFCATYVNDIFLNYETQPGSTLVLGAVLFAIQIYGDFSGYSDIALGVSRIFGIELLQNFSYPYLSRNIAEFWRRWHISLSTWFRDYLYIPLGGSKVSTMMKIRNTFIIFIVSGFWHGANWTFMAWGLLNALYIMPSIIFNSNRNNLEIVSKGKYLPTLKETFNIFLTFLLTSFAWIFFRSKDISQAFDYISIIFSDTLFTKPSIWPKELIPLILFFFIIEWVGRENKFAIATLGNNLPRIIRWIMYIIIALFVFYYSAEEQEFIYFQF